MDDGNSAEYWGPRVGRGRESRAGKRDHSNAPDRGRSREGIPGVAWAVPLYIGIEQARLADGSFQNIQLVGLDTGTLTGRPMNMRAGRIEDLRLPNAVVVDQVAVEKFRRKGIKIALGTTFEINDKEARVVGICHVSRSFLGQPYVYTTYDRALEYAKPSRKMLGYVLTAPTSGVSNEELAKRISALPGLRAIAKDQFFGIRSVGISKTPASRFPSARW